MYSDNDEYRDEDKYKMNDDESEEPIEDEIYFYQLAKDSGVL